MKRIDKAWAIFQSTLDELFQQPIQEQIIKNLSPYLHQVGLRLIVAPTIQTNQLPQTADRSLHFGTISSRIPPLFAHSSFSFGGKSFSNPPTNLAAFDHV